jgi:UMF1 family MFS transporter
MLKKGDKKLMNGWAFYDWANSVYSLVVATAIFPIFYYAVTESDGSSEVEFFGFNPVNTELYSYVVGASFLVVSAISPLLSGIADASGRKKLFLQIFCYLGSAACISLYFFDPAHLEISMLSVFIASIGFWGSIVFYNAYLPEIAEPADHDRLSARGFSMGYLGSVILLVINLVMIQVLDIPAKWSFVLVGLWWAGFAQITFARLPKNPYNRKPSNEMFRKGFRELKSVFNQVRQTVRLKRFLLAFFVFSMSVQTIMLMAQFFGMKEVYRVGENGEKIQGLEDGQLILAIILVQVIAIPGAWLFSRLSMWTSNLKTLIWALIVWIGVCLYAYLIVDNPIEFYIAAGLIGFVMGGTQSLSRSTYSKFLPETMDHASFFSFYDVLEKIGIVIGMVAFGYIEGITGSMRNSVLSLIIFFGIGLLLLLFVPREEKKKIA